MVELQLPTPFGWPDDATGGTTADDMQRILAAQYEPRVRGSKAERGGIIRHAGWTNDGNGIELKSDATVRVHEGVVLLDVALNKAVQAVVPATESVPVPLSVGKAGKVTFYVAPPKGGSNNAILGTTTSTSVDPSWVVLDRLDFKAGWKTTRDATRDWDRVYAVLFGTASGELSRADDFGKEVRTRGPRYKRLAQSFVVPTDCIVSLGLSSTIRACTTAGQPVDKATGVVGTVFYQVFVDGTLLTTFERTVDPFLTTQFWEMQTNLSAGRHEVWVESYGGPELKPGQLMWHIAAGGPNKSRGDFLRVIHQGVRA